MICDKIKKIQKRNFIYKIFIIYKTFKLMYKFNYIKLKIKKINNSKIVKFPKFFLSEIFFPNFFSVKLKNKVVDVLSIHVRLWI